MLSMVGQTVTVTTTTGQVLEGIFHTFSPFEVNKGLVNNDMQNIYCFKAVRVIKKGNDESDSSFKNGSTVLIPTYKVANVQVKSMRLDVVNANEAAAATVASPTNNTEDAAFQTDSQISGGRGGNQNLVAAGSAWTSVGDGGLGGGLDDDSHARATGATTAGNGKGSDALNWRRAASGSSGARSAPSSGGLPKTSGDMKGSIGDWDQFSANEKKFGVKTTFDENLYTTKLDMKKIDEKRHAEAERIAAEIEGTVSTNIHIATERNQAIAMDYDDEDLYSGVLTKDLKARAVPDNEKKSGKVMNYAAAAQAAAKKGKSDEPTSVDNATEGSGAKDGGARKSQVSDTEALSDLSKVNVSSEEKKVEPENDKAAATDKTTDATKSDTDDNEKDGEAEKKDEKKTETKLKLNPNAKSFSFNPSAKTFTPSFANPPSAPAAPMQPLPPMDGQMMPPHPQEYPGGPPMMGGMGHQYAPMPGMMPVMNAQHPQMRQYPGPPYGAPPQQGQQPLPPPLQQGVALPPPTTTTGQQDGDNTSVNTGEGSAENAAAQPQQQYMQQPGAYGTPHGAYPGYNPYGMQGRGMYPPGNHPQMHPGQMQVLPPGGPYAPRGMYPPQQHMMQHNMMRGPPQPYYGGGPGPGYQPGPGYHPQQHGGGNNPDHDKNRNNNNNNSNNKIRGNGGRQNDNSRNNKKWERKNSDRTTPRKQYNNQNSQDSVRSSDGGNAPDIPNKKQEKAQDVIVGDNAT